jgi:hypothetical protein
VKTLYTAVIIFFLAGCFVTAPRANAQGRTTGSLPVIAADTTAPKIVGLKTVEVTVARPPFTLRNDTLEFDASAIKMAANASVLQLLKKLPGVVIGNDGRLTVNGKPVNRIKVDGREFFGDNKEAATKYLPAEIIDKIEVTATKDIVSERSLAVKTPAEDVTLNLVLKKDKNTGIIGNITTGAGSRDRYLTEGMISSMRNPTRISVMATAKNVEEEPGNLAAVSTSGMGGGGGGGLSEYNNGSINVNTKTGKKLTLDVNYSYSNTKNKKEEISDRLNLLPDSSFRNQSTNEAIARNRQHQLFTNIVYERDSLTTWTFRTNAGIGKSNSSLQTYSSSKTTTGDLLNTLFSGNNGEVHTRNGGNEINFNKTSRNRKLNLNTTWKFDAGNKKQMEHNDAINNFYASNIIRHRDSISQYISSSENNFNNNFTFNLSASIGHGFVLALDYTLATTYSRQLREVFKKGPVSGKYDMLDSTLSSSNENASFTHTPALQFAWKSDRLSIALNTGMWILQQENRLLWLDSVIKIHQQQFAPNLQLNYTVSKYGQLLTNYSISSSAPSAEQLSSVVDNTNPMFMKVGNPLLKGTFTQNLSVTFFAYQPVTGFSLNVGGNGSIARNEIVTDQRYDSMGRQTSTYQNVNGTWRAIVHGNINLQKKKNDWTFNSGLNISINRNRSIGLVSGEENISNAWITGAGVYFSIAFKDWLTISPAVNAEVNKTAYSLPGTDNVTYNTQRINVQWQLIPIKRLELSGDMVYNYNSQLTVPAQRRYFICNGAVAYGFGKKEQMKLKCRVNDLFNNNMSVSNVTTANYVETKQVNALQRYVMISFQYFFGKMGPQSISL